MNRSSAPASSPARALPPIPDPGSWASWGRPRRRFVALTVVAWVAVAVVAAVAMALNEVRVLLALLPLLAWEWWIQDRLQAAEGAERTWAYDPPETPDERALLDELDGTRSEREADLVIAREMLAGSAVVRRYEYPTRELLVVRSLAEAVQILGLALVILTAPAVCGRRARWPAVVPRRALGGGRRRERSRSKAPADSCRRRGSRALDRPRAQARPVGRAGGARAGRHPLPVAPSVAARTLSALGINHWARGSPPASGRPPRRRRRGRTSARGRP